MKSRAAVWMFEQLGLDSALLGDLLEERARGRSAVWYWRQLLTAILIGLWRSIAGHKLLALRAIATGCAVNGVWFFLWSNFLHIGLPLRPAMTWESSACLLLILLVHVMTGWAVARTHRTQAVPMVLVFALWLLLWRFADTAFSQTEPRFLPHLAWYLAPSVAEVIGLGIGGILGNGTHRVV